MNHHRHRNNEHYTTYKVRVNTITLGKKTQSAVTCAENLCSCSLKASMKVRISDCAHYLQVYISQYRFASLIHCKQQPVQAINSSMQQKLSLICNLIWAAWAFPRSLRNRPSPSSLITFQSSLCFPLSTNMFISFLPFIIASSQLMAKQQQVTVFPAFFKFIFISKGCYMANC